jgi:hypothetical protein
MYQSRPGPLISRGPGFFIPENAAIAVIMNYRYKNRVAAGDNTTI